MNISSTKCLRWNSRQRNSLAVSVIGGGLFALLTLSSCAQGDPSVPENTLSATKAPSEDAGSAQPAGSVFDSLISMADEAAGATGTSGWTYEDGSAWDPGAPDIVFSPGPCGTLAAGGDRRFLQFALIGPPAAVPPADARERMREYLEENGFEVTKSMDPPPGNEPKNTYEVAGRRTDGAIVDYGANNAEQILNLRSQCSAHPSMKNEVSAQTR